MLSKFGTYVHSTHEFDPSAFGLSAQEAALMDPQQRLLLQGAAEALAAAPTNSASFLPTTPSAAAAAAAAAVAWGVFVGASSMDYGRLIHSHSPSITAYNATGKGEGNETVQCR